MASNPWQSGPYSPTTPFTDKLGRTFDVRRAQYVHRSGKGCAARAYKKAVRRKVGEYISRKAAALDLGVSLAFLNEILDTEV